MLNALLRPANRPILLLLLIGSWLLVGCGIQDNSTNWPAMSADGDRVYVAYGPQVVAVDIIEQKEVWAFPNEASSALLLAPPSIEDNSIVFGDFGVSRGFFSPGVLTTAYALEETGDSFAQRWTAPEIADDKIVAGAAQSADAIFIGSADNFIVALDQDNGNEIWRHEFQNGIWAQPTFANGLVYVTSMDHTLTAFEADSGAIRWQNTYDGAIAAAPIIEGGVIYLSGFDNTVRALDSGNGSEIWSAGSNEWVWGAPAVGPDAVYYVDALGTVYAVDRSDGNAMWQQPLEVPVQAPIAYSDGNLYVAAVGDREEETGLIVALDANNGADLWRQVTSEPLYTAPAIIDNDLVVLVNAEDALLTIFDKDSGAQRWSFVPALNAQ